MKNIIYILALLIFTTQVVHASEVSYEAVESFHRDRLNSISQEYDLENRIKISFSLSPEAVGKKKEQQIIKLPGLLLDALSLNASKRELGLVEIIDALKDYKRKIVILKTSEVSVQELEVVKKAVQEELFIKSSEAFTVKEWTSNTGYQKFKDSLYSGVIMSPKAYMAIFAFLIISFLIFMLANSILNGFKHVGKSIYDSVEKSFSAGQYDVSNTHDSYDKSEELAKNEDSDALSTDGSSREVIEEYNDIEIDCPTILRLFESVYLLCPYELSFKMWDFFPEIEDQLNLYVTFESHLEEHEMFEFKILFNKIFNVENSMTGHVELRPKAFNKTRSLWMLQVALTHLSVRPVDAQRELLFSVFIENYQGQIDKIIEKSINQHYKILNFLFQAKVSEKVNKKSEINDELSGQILNYVSVDKTNRIPNDLEIKAFKDFLSKNNYFVDKDAENETALEYNMLSRLPDHILFSKDRPDSAKLADLKSLIPNFSWLDGADAKIHKKFLLSLSPDEAGYLINFYENYSEMKKELDSRTLSRMQEFKAKASSESSTKVITGLRNKIKFFYSPVQVEPLHESKEAA